MKQFLILLAKEPRAGKVKTRLVPWFSREESAHLGDAFLRDSLERFGEIRTARRILAVDPAGAVRRLKGRMRETSGWELKGQCRGSLGIRLWQLVRWSFKAGSKATVLIGSDSPTLPVKRIDEAFRALRSVSTVVGPSTDGGYYLMGLARPKRALFQGIPWSTSRVFESTLDRLRKMDMSFRVLRPWYDVDTPLALMRLNKDLQRQRREKRKNIPRRTARFLKRSMKNRPKVV